MEDKIILKKSDSIFSPFFIIDVNPFVFIKTEILLDKSSMDYKFELFKFYQNINQKIK